MLTDEIRYAKRSGMTHAEFEQAYADRLGTTRGELHARNIWSKKCRCKPGMSDPHCGRYLMYRDEPPYERLTDPHADDWTAPLKG